MYLRTNDTSAKINTPEIAVDAALSCTNSNMLLNPVPTKRGELQTFSIETASGQWAANTPRRDLQLLLRPHQCMPSAYALRIRSNSFSAYAASFFCAAIDAWSFDSRSPKMMIFSSLSRLAGPV